MYETDVAPGVTVLVGHFADGYWVKFSFSDGREREIGPFADKETAWILVDEFEQECRKITGVGFMRPN